MESIIATYILFVGLIIVISIFIKYGFDRIGLPALLGYFALGIIAKYLDNTFSFLNQEGIEIIEFLADLGIIALLLKIGLESKLSRLIKLLPKASIIWVGDVLISGAVGFLTSYYLIGWEIIPSLFVATAFTATSVGISANVWDEMGAIKSDTGQTLLDVAEMDDISGILLMGILFSIAPVLLGEGAGLPGVQILTTVGVFLLKLTLFGLICVLFSRFIGEQLIETLNKLHGGKSRILVVVGIGLMAAAISTLLGFSFAIGAFLIGVLLSSNPSKVKMDSSFEALYALFVPFFFINIGMNVDLSALFSIEMSLLLLIAAAFIGKFLGAGLGTWVSLGLSYSTVIGLSMIPRAEIFLIIMKRGLDMGEWAVTAEMFTYAVVISTLSVIIVPLLLKNILNKREVTDGGKH
ncbi:cation:proton antiporter [Rhodohalobacter sulfatireducens]|uniref:Cation:proton antiporter n=1 Tax=Rhodohalobacter sulfatireducens TaxID=2911366 RepID=A0ABS9K8Y7_9BACT|nr:cation:proton antiporter [Rhodohalobacter sulfatireducens]MCG2587323.1 cation:proton antiporter [Rhodohalobacter sulfatireducens]